MSCTRSILGAFQMFYGCWVIIFSSILLMSHGDESLQLSWQPDLGLISSSLDTTIKITDVTKATVLGTATVHSRGVSAFAYSPSFSVVASGGLGRDILLWEPSNLRQVGELVGHTAPITHLSLDSSGGQVIIPPYSLRCLPSAFQPHCTHRPPEPISIRSSMQAPGPQRVCKYCSQSLISHV